MKSWKEWLIERFMIERKRFDRSGVYAYTQMTMAYNSNKIEGSILTPEQTASLFDNGSLPQSDNIYRAKDVEEMNGHFLMFNYMLDTLEEDLTQELIKRLHFELKSGVFEDRANGYAIGDYKKRPNMVGMHRTTLPADVADEMENLLEWYGQQEKSLDTLAAFHAKYEMIHPFQDGNGRTGRVLMNKFSLENGHIPFVIPKEKRDEYMNLLAECDIKGMRDFLYLLMKYEEKRMLDFQIDVSKFANVN